LQDISHLEHTLTDLDTEHPMTFILGARCKDGVVLISDKKVTLDYGADFDYREKLFGDLRHVIIGSSGSTNTFEYFRGYIMDYVNTNKNNKKAIKYDNIITRLAEIVYNTNKRHKFQNESNFHLLVAVGFSNKKSSLTHISAYGWPRTIDGCIAIGSGQHYAKIFQKHVWNPNMNMKEVAEIGYFTIKYIEEFGLDQTVGLDGKQPQIWFIRDRLDDKQATKQFLTKLEKNTETRLKLHRTHLDSLFDPATINTA
jgi:20S proteasome alpha/beta subunit